MKLINTNTIIIFLILVLLTIPAVFPLFRTGFMVTDDGGWMIIRLSAFYDTIRDGQIPARFIERLNFGYGYPVANFLYPGYLYLGSVIHLIGFNFIDTVKILFGLSILFSSIFSFIWLKKLFGNLDSLIGSLVYLYAPYHLFDIYKRGSLGEALSISVLPLAFYGIEKASTILIALSVFSVLLFHNSLVLFFLPLIPMYAFVRKSFIRSLPGIVLGIAVSSFFTVPAIMELRYTKFFQTPISDPLEYFADFQLAGVVVLVITGLSIVLPLVIYKKEYSKIPYRGLVIVFIAVLLISLFLSTFLSSVIWANIGASFVQFPYRILSLSLIAASFLGAYLSYVLFSKAKFLLFILITLLLTFFSYKYLIEVKYENFPDEYYSTNDSTTTIHDEYMPVWVKEKPIARPSKKAEIISGSGVIKNISESSNKIEINTDISSDSRLRLNTIYYPGWEAVVDGEKSKISYDNNLGVIEVDLKQYDNKVAFIFKDDLVRTLSNTITILAALILVYYISRPLIKF